MTMALRGTVVCALPDVSADEAFTVLGDIARYPEFLPFCQEAQVLSHHGHRQRVFNRFGWGLVSHSFHTHAVFDPPQRLVITSNDGPFRDFRLAWAVASTPQGCDIAAEYAMTLRHDWLQRLLAVAAPQMEKRLVAAFQARILERARKKKE